MNNITLQIKKELNYINKNIHSYSINYSQQLIANALIDQIQSEFRSTQFTLSETNAYIQQFNATTTMHTIYQLGPIIINILTNKQLDIPSRLLMERIIKRLYVIYKIFKINKNFNFWLIPTDSNRWFPKHGIVMPKHINGGFTYVTNNSINNSTNNGIHENANIFIYRREEFPKVMIHELMHHSYIDNSHNSNKTNTNTNKDSHQEELFINRLKHVCNISTNTKFLPNEGIIEAWALLLQSLFISLEYNIPFNTIIQIENKWSNKQAARILYYKNKENKENNHQATNQHSNQHNKKDNQWEETTNSYCYVVIKTLLLKDINSFINNSLNGTINKYIEKTINSYLHTIKPKPYIHKHFRMTIFGDL